MEICWNPKFEKQAKSDLYYVFAAINRFHVVRDWIRENKWPWDKHNRAFSVFGDFDCVLELHRNAKSLGDFTFEITPVAPRFGIFKVEDIFLFSGQEWKEPKGVFEKIYYPDFHKNFRDEMPSEMLGELDKLDCLAKNIEMPKYGENQTLRGFIVFMTRMPHHRKEQVANEIIEYFKSITEARLITLAHGICYGELQGDLLIEFELPSIKKISQLVVDKRESLFPDAISRTYIVSGGLSEFFASTFDLGLPYAETENEYYLARLPGVKKYVEGAGEAPLSRINYIGKKHMALLDYIPRITHDEIKDEYPLRSFEENFIVLDLESNPDKPVTGVLQEIKDFIEPFLKKRMKILLKKNNIKEDELHEKLDMDSPMSTWNQSVLFEAASRFYGTLKISLLARASVNLFDRLKLKDISGPIDYVADVLFPIIEDLLDYEPENIK